MEWPRVARIADTAVVTALVVAVQAEVWTGALDGPAGDRTVHAVLLAVATLPLYVRRRWPLGAVLLLAASSWVHAELGAGSQWLWFAFCLALFSLGSHGDRRALVLGSVVVAGVVLWLDVPRLVAGEDAGDVFPAWFILAAIVGVGHWFRHRRRETTELAARAEVAERTRAEHAARAVADERARIARELHDLVAHAMGVIVIQAQAGQRAVASDPDAARSAFGSIETAGRQGLAEMRRLLQLLTTAGDSSVAPQPSLRQLDDLVAPVRAAGVPVEVDVTGDVGQLPAGVDLAAYRIVQEALTNVIKHAGPASARVNLRLVGGALDVEVCDDGTRPFAGAGGGHGLVGMGERASLYGGTVETGRLPGGGFRVHARLAVDGVPV